MMDLFPITNIINSYYLLENMRSGFDAYFDIVSFDAQMYLVLTKKLIGRKYLPYSKTFQLI